MADQLTRSGTSIMITINDILDDLKSENKRLLNEILFANKCLNELKTHLNQIHSKYETLVDEEDKQHFSQLSQRLDQLNDKTYGDQCLLRLGAVGIRGDNTYHKHNRLLKREHNDEEWTPETAHTNGRRSGTNDTTKADRINRLRQQYFNSCDKDIRFVCPLNRCDKSFTRVIQLKKHLMTVHKKGSVKAIKAKTSTLRVWRCLLPECQRNGISFPGRKGLNEHNIQYHELDVEKPFVCTQEDCDFRTKYKHAIQLHLVQRHSNARPYRCEHEGCGRTFKLEAGLRSHLRTHSEGSFVCTVEGCDRRFRRKHELSIHSAQHTNIPYLKCTYDGCGQRFFNSFRLRKHQQEVHNRVVNKYNRQFQLRYEYPCDWPGCDYVGHHIVQHKRLHTGELPYVCDWPDCDKRFRVIRHLRDHQNIHKNLKPYTCHWPGCQYKCASGGNIWNHIKESHKIIKS